MNTAIIFDTFWAMNYSKINIFKCVLIQMCINSNVRKFTFFWFDGPKTAQNGGHIGFLSFQDLKNLKKSKISQIPRPYIKSVDQIHPRKV